jgi:hypothetical protein
VTVYRHADPRFPFLWETVEQAPGRWHDADGGPVQYLADTPDGAWAEFLRHEEIRTPAELATVRRALWAIELGDDPFRLVALPRRIATGGADTMRACRRWAAAVRKRGTRRIHAPSAALRPGSAHGWRVDGGLKPGPRRDAWIVVLFGRRPDLLGWQVVARGGPPAELLDRVRHYR